MALRGAMEAGHTTSFTSTSWAVYFDPDDDSTRRAAAIGVATMASLTAPIPGQATFDDVPLSAHGRDEIETLYALGETSGCGGVPLSFCPDEPLTRATAATFVVRALKILDPTLDLTPPANATFADVDTSYPLFMEVEAAHSLGLMAPCGTGPTIFCPESPVSRADLAELLVASFDP